MLIKKASIAAMLAAAGMALSSASMAQQAQDQGGYIGGSFGQSAFKGDLTFCGLGVPCDEKDTAWKIFGGYQFSRNFAAEFGYSNLGESSFNFVGLNASIESTVWELVGVGSVPLANQFSAFGKLGLYRAESEGTTNIPGVGNVEESNTGLTFGFGVRYDFTRNLGVRAEWQRYSDVGGSDLGEGDVNVMSVGLIWKF
jgi:OmpA-OmpF porin, OOP family